MKFLLGTLLILSGDALAAEPPRNQKLLAVDFWADGLAATATAATGAALNWKLYKGKE
jgi:hypothetical protein